MGRRAANGPREEWVTWRVSAAEIDLLERCTIGSANRADYLRKLVREDAERRGITT